MAIEVKGKWSGDAFIRAMEKHIDNNVERAALVLVGDIVNAFKGSGTPGATKAERRASPSGPGEIPHVQEAGLKQSVTNAKAGPQQQHVGSTIRAEPGQMASYPLMLELGTKKMASRPWLRLGLKRAQGKINRELQRKSNA